MRFQRENPCENFPYKIEFYLRILSKKGIFSLKKDRGVMRRFLITFSCMFVALVPSSGQTSDFDPVRQYKEKRGAIVLEYLDKGETSCQKLWDEREERRLDPKSRGISDYDLPAVTQYCSRRYVGWRKKEGGEVSGENAHRRIFVDAAVKKGTISHPTTQTSSFRPSSPSPQEAISIPRSIQPSVIRVEENNDQGFSEPAGPHRVITSPVARSLKPVKPVQWNGGTREIGTAQARLEGVYEKTKSHMEEMYEHWKQLEGYQCNGKEVCLARLKKLKRDLDEHIQGLEKRYVDSLEGQNEFLKEELERHLQEDRSHLSERVVDQLHAYLTGLQAENADLAEKIQALRREGDVLVNSLEGRASHQVTEAAYEKARTGKKGKTLKVKDSLDSLKTRFAELQREGRALQAEIVDKTGHTCAGVGCDQVRVTLGHAQTYETNVEGLEQNIDILGTQVAQAKGPNEGAKSTANREIRTLSSQVKQLETVNVQSIAALQAGLEKAQKTEAELRAQIASLEKAAENEKLKAQKEAETATLLEQQAQKTVVRSTDEARDLSALEARAQRAEREAAQHKQKAEALEAEAHTAVKALEKALGISLDGNELASLAGSKTPAQRIGAVLLEIENQKREMETQKATLDRQADQLNALQKDSQKDQAQIEELQRAQAQQAETLQNAKKVEEGIKRFYSATGYVDTRKLEARIKELEALLKEEAAEKKRVNDIVALQKLALSKKKSDLDKQAATMKAIEAERERLEAGLRDQKRTLQSQLKEVEELRNSKLQSGQTAEEFERVLSEKQKLVDNLKLSVAKAQGQFSAQQKRIIEQRKALDSLEKAHTKQKDILGTAFLVAKKLNNENDELRGTLEAAGTMGRQALAERDAAKEKLLGINKDYADLQGRYENLKQGLEKGREVFDTEMARLEQEKQAQDSLRKEKEAAAQEQRNQYTLEAAKRHEEFDKSQQTKPDVSQRLAEVRRKIAETIASKKK